MRKRHKKKMKKKGVRIGHLVVKENIVVFAMAMTARRRKRCHLK